MLSQQLIEISCFFSIVVKLPFFFFFFLFFFCWKPCCANSCCTYFSLLLLYLSQSVCLSVGLCLSLQPIPFIPHDLSVCLSGPTEVTHVAVCRVAVHINVGQQQLKRRSGLGYHDLNQCPVCSFLGRLTSQQHTECISGANLSR